MISSAEMLARQLQRDGYNITNPHEVMVGLEEDLGYSYEEAVSLVQAVVEAGKSLRK